MVFPYYYTSGEDSVWTLVVVAIESNELCWINPTAPVMQPSEQLTADLAIITQALLPLLNHCLPVPPVQWQCKPYPLQYYDALISTCDSGVYVAVITYFLCLEVPLAFQRTDIVNTRYKLAYWLMCEKLPI